MNASAVKTSETMAERCAARAYLYSLFGRIFGSEPSEEVRRALVAPLTAQACAVAGEGGAEEEASSLTRVLAEAAQTLSADEYTRLFIGPGAPQALPWESAHVSPSRSLFTRDTLEVRAFYRRCGYRAQGSPQLPDDHLATELLFMAALAAEPMDSAATDDAQERQAQFLDEHLLRWLSRFTTQVMTAAPASCYASLAQALQAFVAADREQLIAAYVA